ncbi:hypothetical protein Saga11_08870 [Bacillus safensis]|nr:hypothetical protein Saga11_08870 [Bacillus safensis]
MSNNLRITGAIIFVPVFLLSMFLFWREQFVHFDISRVTKNFDWNVPLIIKSNLCSVLKYWIYLIWRNSLMIAENFLILDKQVVIRVRYESYKSI